MSSMIPGLDGLRAIAFLLVFALHTDNLDVGWVGVSLFFVLSGFLITGILLDMKKSLATKEYFFKFYGRRFLRIFPLYYFYLLLMALVTTGLISISFSPNVMQIFLDQVWYAVVYVYDFFYATANFQHSHFLDHFWSLSVEEQFYIFWPLLLSLVPERSLKRLFISFIVFGGVFRLLFFIIHSLGVFPFLVNTPSNAIYPLPFSHLDAFAFGAYISCFPIPRAKLQFFLLLGLLPAIGFASQYIATGKIGTISAFGYPPPLPHAYQFIWGYSLLNYFFAVIIYGVAREGWFAHFLELPIMSYLGKISYGLYVYHFPIAWFSARIADLGIAPPLLQPLVRPLMTLVALAITILVASLSYQFIESPIINLKDRFFSLKSSEKNESRVALAVQ